MWAGWQAFSWHVPLRVTPLWTRCSVTCPSGSKVTQKVETTHRGWLWRRRRTFLRAGCPRRGRAASCASRCATCTTRTVRDTCTRCACNSWRPFLLGKKISFELIWKIGREMNDWPIVRLRCCAASPASWDRHASGNGRPWTHVTSCSRAGRYPHIRPTPSLHPATLLRNNQNKNHDSKVSTGFNNRAPLERNWNSSGRGRAVTQPVISMWIYK